jgi:hypothetical protein
VAQDSLQIQVVLLEAQDHRPRPIKEGVKDLAVTHLEEVRLHLRKTLMARAKTRMTIITTSTTRAKEHIRSSKSLVATTKKAHNK